VLYSYTTPFHQNAMDRKVGRKVMRPVLDDSRPLYLQIKEAIEDDILHGRLGPGDQIPSNRELVAYYNINPVTVMKGINLLVDEGTIYKKRGLGMFVSDDAPEKLRKHYSKTFVREQIMPMVALARPLGFTLQEIHDMIDRAWKGKEND
jgi:GntR family transcriptional regulator